MTTAAIIQARMNSQRLPGKVLMKLGKWTTLEWITSRVFQAKCIDKVIIATSVNPENDIIERFFSEGDVNVFRGDEEDVMKRVIEAANKFNVDVIADITGDCPMVDHRHIDYLYSLLIKHRLDYASNCITRTWPDGLDIQIYKTEALKTCRRIFQPKTHVGWNIGRHQEFFRCLEWTAPIEMRYPQWGLTLDTIEDKKLLTMLFEYFEDDRYFKVEDVINFLKENPCLVDINKYVKRKDPFSEG